MIKVIDNTGKDCFEFIIMLSWLIIQAPAKPLAVIEKKGKKLFAIFEQLWYVTEQYICQK